jgi:hypothetical protein
MAPKAQNPPASTGKQAVHETVANHVAGDFLSPIWAVSQGHAAMPWTTVPEAAINEDGQALTAENEVGPAEEKLMASPAGDSRRTQNGN